MSLVKSEILQLYKSLFRYGQQLKYTDKSYYYSYIRNQFEKSGQNSQQIENLYKKGNQFLANKRVI